MEESLREAYDIIPSSILINAIVESSEDTRNEIAGNIREQLEGKEI